VVFDASAVARALVDHDLLAVEWLGRLARGEVHGTCPDLLYVEMTNTVLKHQRAGRLGAQDAKAVLDATAAVPFATHTAKSLAVPAWIIASERGLSAYDACYVVLAETMGATLITADRRLAAATTDAVLITG
jgi:predicted nucleic acid-binding protein